MRAILWKAARAGALGLVIGVIGIEVLAARLNKAAGVHGFVSFHIWPPVFNTDVFTEFVHLAAILFGLTLAVAVALAVILAESMRTLLFLANHVDDTAKVVLDRIVGTSRPVVSAADRPDRQQFLGEREP